MSDFSNPYQSPANPSVPEQPLTPSAVLTGAMLQYLKEASPWLRFIGILGFIGCGFTALGGIISMFSSFLFASASAIGGASMGVIGITYLGIAVLSFFPSYFTFNFGLKIRNYLFSNSEEDLEQAFKNNKSLWKFSGILCIIFLALIPVMIIVAIVGGVAMATSGMFF